jgi:hypothetical protein
VTDIGPFTTSDCFELVYNKPDGPPIEIDIEVSGIVFCDDPEWGIEARDVTAKVVERELTDEEIEALDLENTLATAFHECEPCVPRPGDRYKDLEDHTWKVVDTCLTWGTTTRERYVLLERPNTKFTMRGPRKIRRLVPLGEFREGVDEDSEELKPLFRFTLGKKPKPGQLHPPGDTE